MKKLRIMIIVLILPAIYSGCSKKIFQPVIQENFIVFPSPPDTARIQFLKKISNSIDVAGEQSNFVKFIMGESNPLEIRIPYGISISKGVLYVCDISINAIWKIDLKNNKFETLPIKGLGQLERPVNCFVDDKDIIFVTDRKREQVILFSKDGRYINAMGEKENFIPIDVFVYKEKIYVSNIANNCINVYDRNTLKLLTYFPKEESSPEEHLYTPQNICIYNDRIYISDLGDYRVKIFTLDGKFIKALGSHGTNLGQFVRPKGIAVDREENIYVVDAASEFTQIFNKKGQLLLFFGGPYKGPGDMYLPAKIIIDYDNLDYFQKYVNPEFTLKYLIIVTNQYGPDKIGIYGAVNPKQ